LTAFVSARRFGYQSEARLTATNSIQESMEEARLAVGVPSPGGMSLNPGVYVDQKLGTAPFKPPPGAIPLATLDMPAEWQARYQTNPGTDNTWDKHGDGRVMVVEDHLTDRDGDGLTGSDFDGDGQVDLYRVKVRLRWSTPTA